MVHSSKKLISALIVGALLLAGCSSLSLPVVGDGGCEAATPGLTTVTEGKFTVAASPYPPFTEFEADGSLGGLDGDILSGFAESECLELVLVKDDASEMFEAVISGRTDTFGGGWYRTTEREELFLQGTPVLEDRIFFISKEAIDTVDQLEGRKVGSIEGFGWTDPAAEVVGSTMKIFTGIDEMYAALESGEIEIIIDTFPSAQAILAENPNPGLVFTFPTPSDRIPMTKEPGQSNYPVNFDNRPLLLALNNYILDYRDSGELLASAERHGFKPESVTPGPPRLL